CVVAYCVYGHAPVTVALCSAGCCAYPVVEYFPTRRSSDLRISIEYLDTKRFSFQRQEVLYVEYLKEKYRTLDIKGIICSDNDALDRKSTRLNSSHVKISYAVFCLKKKDKNHARYIDTLSYT